MAAAKDTQTVPQSNDRTTAEIAKTVVLATQACNGFELSDEELEALCDSMLKETSRFVCTDKNG